MDGTTAVFYIDGVGDAAVPLSVRVPQTGPATIGHSAGFGIYWIGHIDEVAIYPKVLTPTQVLAHYAARTGTAPPVVIGGPPWIIIATVDHTLDTRAYSLRYEYQLGARGRAEFEIVDDDSTAAAYRPQIDSRVELKHNTTVLFRGKILSLTDKPLGIRVSAPSRP